MNLLIKKRNHESLEDTVDTVLPPIKDLSKSMPKFARQSATLLYSPIQGWSTTKFHARKLPLTIQPLRLKQFTII